MEISLVLKYENEQGEIVSCVLNGEEVIIPNFKYEATRMAGAPTISFSIKNAQLLDEFWNDTMFVEFRGEKYYLAHIPSSSLSNEDGIYTHEVEMVSERAALDNVYFYDVVSDDTEDDRPASNSSEVTFHGTIEEFVERMNSSLQYAKLQTKNEDGTYSGYQVVIDGDVESESKLLAFKNETMSSVLQTIYQTYNLPYYFIGKEIHIGYESEIISTVFEYGVDDALLSIEKENSNNKVINRCTGYGSSDNLPYFYPNSTPLGNIGVEFTGDEITSATIEDGNKFSGNSLLENTLTYSELYSNRPNGVSYGYWINGVGTTDLLAPFADIKEISAKTKGVGVFAIINTANDNFEGQRNINIRFSIKIDHIAGSNAVAIQKYKDKLIVELGSVHLFYNGGKSQALNNYTVNKEDDGKYFVSINYNIREGNTYKIECYPVVTVPNLSTNEYIELSHGVTCDLKVNMEVTYANNDSYVVGYGWAYTDANGEQKVQSLSNIGVVVKGTPNVGDTLKFNLIGRRLPNQGALMPSIFRQTMGKERFYNATNGTYEGYVFPNPYVEGQPKEYIKEFADIKPTITGMLNDEDIPIDRFLDFEYDDNDDNEVEEIDDELIVKHPYFFAKLPKLGFNLFEHASENGEMTISMTSGNCGACNFVIAVDTQQEGKFINTVQVGSNGRPLKDENGNVVCGRKYYQPPLDSAQPEQNDTTNNEVWIALKKEDETYGMQMPFREKTVDANGDTIETSILPSVEDTFVILNINLPENFISAAEERLDKAILDYMLENNQEKFSYSIDFSRIYLQEHPEILAQLTENARIQIKYNDRIYEQFVSSFSYNVDSTALPEIKVELAEKLELYESPIDRAMTEMGYAFGEMLSALNVPAQCLPYFIRKDVEDTAYRKITFREGAEFGRYESGAIGTGGAISIDGNGNSIAEFDYLNVRKKATFTELTIQELKNIGGQLILSPAAMQCSRAIKLENGNYRCYFEKSNDVGDEVLQEFIVGDLARCQTLNLKYSRYYWREVVGVGDDYIDLSATSCDPSITNDEPLAGDTIVSLGNISDTTRQAAIILSAYGTNAPSMTQYAGIDGFTLEGKMVTKFSNGDNVITGKMTILPNSTGAANLADLEIGASNMIRNSGFTGDYVSKELDDDVVLEAATQLYSDPLDHWVTLGSVVVQDSTESISGKEVVVTGLLSQTLDDKFVIKENYVLSFKAKGGSIAIQAGNTRKNITLSEEYAKYTVNILPNTSNNVFVLNGVFTACDLQLEKGTIATSWSRNFKDNSSDRTYYQAQKYLTDAIHNASTTIDGGLVLSNVIEVGDYVNGAMNKVNGGISGIYANDNNNVAFWAGGDLQSAMNVVTKYTEDPTYQPTEEELATMAKFVVTHGGRAILNDIILRGYVYAKGGNFGNLKIGKYTNACGGTDDDDSLFTEREYQSGEAIYKDVVKFNNACVLLESTGHGVFGDGSIGCKSGNKIVLDSSFDENENEYKSAIYVVANANDGIRAIDVIGDVRLNGDVEIGGTNIFGSTKTSIIGDLDLSGANVTGFVREVQYIDSGNTTMVNHTNSIVIVDARTKNQYVYLTNPSAKNGNVVEVQKIGGNSIYFHSTKPFYYNGEFRSSYTFENLGATMFKFVYSDDFNGGAYNLFVTKID